MSYEELSLCRQAVELLQAEREGLERLLVRLSGLCASLEPEPLRRGVVEAAVEMAGAHAGFFVATGAPDEPSDVVGELAELPRPGHSPLLAGVLYEGRVLRIDDAGRWARDDRAAQVYGALTDGRRLRSWLA
ncbi:MAG: hypothetical protein ACRD12_05745, partial [Acidimicrobiales bacterium]